jgi:orotidine-5'-phosphate decarboxylase
MPNFADQLLAAIDAKQSPACVALDPVFESLPDELRSGVRSEDQSARLLAIGTFSRRVLELIAQHIPVVKINSAYFECYHADGVRLYDELLAEAAAMGLMTIGDCKRGDVGHTAEMYATAHLGGLTPHAITINGYFGLDGVKPFIDVAQTAGKGVFVLVRTSNPSAAAIQDVVTEGGRKVHEIVASQVNEWATDRGMTGISGYSSIGAVVATRNPADAARLRKAMPNSIFLVPGYGAQGGKASDFAPYFNPDSRGALVAAGRSVIYAFSGASPNWAGCITVACQRLCAETAGILSF